MINLSATVVELELEVLEPLGLGPNKGPALRGAIFESLRDNLNVCLYKHLPSCQPCSLRQVCPLSGLLATVDDASPRGLDVPRPMTLRPPLDDQRVYQPGQCLRFGATLFGDGAKYVPYLVLAARELERSGLGLCLDGRRHLPARRALVRLGAVAAVHPISGCREVVRAAGESTIRPPELRVTAADVDQYAASLSRDAITLDLLTPTRLIQDKSVVSPARFDVLVARLVDRISSLCSHYASAPAAVDRLGLLDAARSIEAIGDDTHWVDIESRSSRTGRWSSAGGYVGHLTFRGVLAPFLPWLVWGTLTHVGKSATRGNGWYRIAEASA